jgi:phosphoglycolate phosphatase-like HAD superfamily hydrolase
MFGPIKYVVFDLDGTLVNTMPSVVRGLSEAVREGLGHGIPTEELVKSFGPAPRDVLAKWMPPERVPAAMGHWLDFESRLGAEDLRPFPGVPELLEGLHAARMPMAVFTGRDRRGALRILELHGWTRFFGPESLLAGDDGFPTKPRHEGLVMLLQRLGFDPATTVMVGDHPHDATAGRAAGCKTAAALWDLPEGQGSQRSRFRAAWTKWDSVPVDVRLTEVGSLLAWAIRPE